MFPFVILVLHSYTRVSGSSCHFDFCPADYIGDKYCYEYCMTPECNYDSDIYLDDKYLTFKNSDCFFDCGCDEEKLTNGKCDPECDTYQCGYDLGDCGYCNSGCFLENLHSDSCILECSTIKCDYYDINPCKTHCAPGCSLESDLYLNNTCKKECLGEVCLTYEYSTCNTIECAKGCVIAETADGKCQGWCYNPECNYDGGDCDCIKGCNDTIGECYTNETYKDPCDTESCKYKDGKCGFCASGCFEQHLGDGICQNQCNTESCNYDYGDCGCANNCSYKYNSSMFIQTGNSDSCSADCLVLDCKFGINFCNDSSLVKSAVLNFLVYKDKNQKFDEGICESTGCKSEDINNYLNEKDTCSEENICNSKECFYCMGKTDKLYDNCLRQSFGECLVCDSTMIEGECFSDISECPSGYEDVSELVNMFGTSRWCLKEPAQYSKSNYKEIYVDSNTTQNGNGTKENPVNSLYYALVNVYASFTKIYLVNNETDFNIDGSSSVLLADPYNPLNFKTEYQTYELWIIGNYSESEKTKIYWKDNLKLSPLSQKFYIKNIEFIGKYVMKNDCDRETCFYCPYAIKKNGLYTDDYFNVISESDYTKYYSKDCSNYFSDDVLSFSKEAYIENVVFSDFRYQYNSFIRSSSVLELKNVNFTKMQAKPAGSVILLECTEDCINSTFVYNIGLVIDIGAGYNDVDYVETGSFFMSLGSGFISITHVTFSFNFAFNYLGSLSNGYLIYSKNHLGTIVIENCDFFANYVNYLVYIDVSSLGYTDYRNEKGTSLAYSQQHFLINKINITSTYCSKGLVYYLMENILHNIKIKDISIKKSVLGQYGVFSFVNKGNIKYSDISGYADRIYMQDSYQYFVYISARFLNLENITIKDSLTGNNAIYIENFSNSILKNIWVSNIKGVSYDLGRLVGIYEIIFLFYLGENPRYLKYFEYSYEKTKLNCNEMILIIDSVILTIDTMTISNITCSIDNNPLGLFIENVYGEVFISKLLLSYMNIGSILGSALTILDSNFISITDLDIFSIENGDESVVKFDKCNKIVIDLFKFSQSTSNYTSAFVVSNSGTLTLNNFLFSNIISYNSNGGCLSLITGSQESSFIIKSGKFIGCSSNSAVGGAIYLENLNRIFTTNFELNKVDIHKSFSTEGSAIYIANNVALSAVQESRLVSVLIQDNDCNNGGVVSVYHYAGVMKIDGLEMINNTRGIYVFFSYENLELFIYNSKINAPEALNSVFYLNSMAQGCKFFFQNVEISNIRKLAIEAYNFEIIIDHMDISNTYQALYFNNQVKCEANNLNIKDTSNTAINFDKNCAFTCKNCEFSQISNSIIAASSNSYFDLSNSKIFSNNIRSGNLLSITSADMLESSIINCLIFNNSLISGSLIYLFFSSLTLKKSYITENEAYSTTVQVIYAYNSVLKIYDLNLHFKSLADSGVFIYAVARSSVIAENTVFENSLSKIGNIYGNNAIIKINNCTFSGNTGGDIYTIESELTIINSLFENSIISRSNSGVLGLSSNYKTVIEGSIFKNISSLTNFSNIAYIYDEASNTLEILNSTLTESSNNIMGIYLEESTSVIIKFSGFSGFMTTVFSAITAISNLKGCKLNIIDSIINENWSDNNGGGVYSESYSLIIENTQIFSNNAQHSGGGVFFTSPNCDDCVFYLLENSLFFNNSCNMDGGAIKWKDFKPIIEDSVLIYNNSAEYGADIASLPAFLGLSSRRSLSESILTTLLNVPPGKKFTDTIIVNIYDTYGKIVKTENSITATLLVNDTEDSGVAISGITTFKTHKGVLSITDFILKGVPGSCTNLKLISDKILSANARNDHTKYTDTVFFQVQFRNCTKGEQIQASACVDCIGGKYTLQASEICSTCPTGATCTGGDVIIVKNGYWRSSLESDIIYSCDVYDACLKGSEINQLGNCSKGYTGVLCKSCEVGYFKKANGICTKCPNEKTNFGTMVFLGLGIILLSFVMVKTTLTSAFSPKSLHSIYIKIFTNYLQLVFIITQFDLEWPSYVTEFFNIQRTTSSIYDQVFSLDCYIALESSEDIENVYYTKLYLIAFFPIFILIFSYFYWIFHGSLYESYKYLKREVYTTIIVLFFLVYPSIVKSMFSNFSCIEIDKMKSYLNENTSIECWDINHKKFSIILVIPSIIIWVIGVPSILLLLMIKNKKRLHLDYYRVVFGFLYNGYKQNRFYWEINIMYRKILLITITVFKISQARVLQALNLIIVLLASIYLHHIYRPYNFNELNNMEMQALNIAAITIYFGLYYLSKNIGFGVKILLFLFMILGNSYFIIYWLYYMFKALFNILIKHFPRFRSFFKRGDAFDDEFYVEKCVREGVYIDHLQGKKAFTFMLVKENYEIEKLNYKSMEDAYLDVAKRDIEKLAMFEK